MIHAGYPVPRPDAQALGPTDSPTFAGGVITGLTALRLVATGAGKELASVADLTAYIAGTANRVTVTSNGSGGVTLTLPDEPTLQRLIIDRSTNPWITFKVASVPAGYVGSGPGPIIGMTNSDIGIRTGSAGSVIFGIGPSEKARFDTYGNLLVGLTAPGTSAQKILGLVDGVAPSTSVAGVQIYSLAGVLYLRTGAGKVINLNQGVAIADATDLASCITAINSLLAQMRTRGLIAT